MDITIKLTVQEESLTRHVWKIVQLESNFFSLSLKPRFDTQNHVQI